MISRGRLIQFTVVAGGMSVAGDLMLPTAGAAGLIERIALFAAIPLVLWLTRFARPDEIAVFRRGAALLRQRLSPAPGG